MIFNIIVHLLTFAVLATLSYGVLIIIGTFLLGVEITDKIYLMFLISWGLLDYGIKFLAKKIADLAKYLQRINNGEKKD